MVTGATVLADGNTATITAASVEAEAGANVDVAVTVNTTGLAAAEFTVDVDGLTVNSATVGESFTQLAKDELTFVVVSAADADVTGEAVLVTLNVAVPADAAEGTVYDITVSDVVAADWAEADVEATVEAGTVTVKAAEAECDHEWEVVSSTAAVGVKGATSTDKAGTETSKGKITVKCAKCGVEEVDQEVSYYDDYRPNTLNLDLAAEILMKFYVTDARLKGAEEVFFVTDIMLEGLEPRRQVLSLAQAEDDTANARQVIPVGVPAKYLTDKVVMNVFVKKDGEWFSGRTYSYSIIDAAHLRDSKANDAEKTMYAALFMYGAKAQKYFGEYKMDNLADSAENLGAFADYAANVVEIPVEPQMTNNRGTMGVRFRAYDYNLEAKTILNLKFTIYEATGANVPAEENLNVRFVHTKADGSEVTYRYNINELVFEENYSGELDRYVVNMGELTSRQWRDPITAYVYNGDTAYDCSFVTSIAGLMEYSRTTTSGAAYKDANLGALYKAMINYGDYADAYFSL